MKVNDWFRYIIVLFIIINIIIIIIIFILIIIFINNIIIIIISPKWISWQMWKYFHFLKDLWVPSDGK